jgi:hypothetical protein
MVNTDQAELEPRRYTFSRCNTIGVVVHSSNISNDDVAAKLISVVLMNFFLELGLPLLAELDAVVRAQTALTSACIRPRVLDDGID